MYALSSYIYIYTLHALLRCREAQAGEQGSGKSSLIYNLFGAFRPVHGAEGDRLGRLAATSLTTYQAETEGATFIFNLQARAASRFHICCRVAGNK